MFGGVRHRQRGLALPPWIVVELCSLLSHGWGGVIAKLCDTYY